MLVVDSLAKSYGEVRAVDGLSFAVGAGEIFGLLGPNGAGKTTTISMIAGVLRPDAGRVVVGGEDAWAKPLAAKRLLGVVPQDIALHEDLSARDNMRFWASLYGMSGAPRAQRIDETLDRVGLLQRANDRVATFSGGMKRRLNLACGLVHRPRLLLLDEPTVGIDPQARVAVLDVVREVAAQGTAVLYTTHHMEEAQQLCARLAIVDHGKILALGTLDELTRLAGEGAIVRLSGSFDEARVRPRLEAMDGLTVLRLEPALVLISLHEGGPGLAALLPALLDPALGTEDVAFQRPSLESVFIRLTGRALRD